MGRRRKVSGIKEGAFPSVETAAITDAELDASIESPELDERRQDSQRKKEIAKIIKDIPPIFAPEQVAWLFTVYVAIISFAYSYVLKADYETIFSELDIDDKTKMEMSRPLARIASKYAPADWAGMSDEIQLITQVGIYTATSFGRVKLVVQREEMQKQKEVEQRRNMPHIPQAQQREATV